MNENKNATALTMKCKTRSRIFVQRLFVIKWTSKVELIQCNI